jgi:hypothetical protein
LCLVPYDQLGERAVTVTDVGWYTLRTKQQRQTLRPTDAVLPMRLEPHDSRTWTISASATSARRHTINEPFVTSVQRPTWRERRKGIEAEREIIGKPGGIRKW